MATSTIRIEGLAQLNRAFKRVDSELAKEFRVGMKLIAEPVRAGAEQKAVETITNIGATWPRMKIGSTTRTVYVAPKSRRKGGSPRTNLAGLLAERAMQPALNENEDEIIRGVERLLASAIHKAGF